MEKNFKNYVQSYYGHGIPFKNSWSMKQIRAATKLRYNYWLDTIYDYEIISKQAYDSTVNVHYRYGKATDSIAELDEFLWEDFTNKLEESRIFFVETLNDFGVSETEAHFMSLNFILSVISKFRVKMFVEFGGDGSRKDFEMTTLRNAVNVLWHRFNNITVCEEYLFSKIATSSQIQEFKIAAAKETARTLVEDCGAVLYAKLAL